ncbi:MAG: hypothetical protein MK110_02360 [Fuerstiella sp.]|nr:hypothetical protein [Fuerstiella sp.]
MVTIDFSRSFLTFRIDTEKKPLQTASHRPAYSLNNARIQIECRLQVTDRVTDLTQSFVLGASCKTERVGVPRDIWLVPNADFAPVFSDTEFMNVKTYAQVSDGVELYPPGSGTQSERQRGKIADAFDSVRIDIAQCSGTELTSAADIVQATLNNMVLNARTTIETDRYSAVMEYPVKTMNANERDNIYQTDTGPVLYPDLTVEPDKMLQQLQFAYTAVNCPHWIELLVRTATEVSDDIDVYHYSQSVRHDARNEIIGLS